MGKKKRDEINSILTYEEADLMIASIGADRRQLEMIQTAMNEDLATIKGEYEAKAAPIAEDIDTATESVRLFCEANRKTLCPDDVKTHRFPSGEVNWRAKPKSVSVGKNRLAGAIDWLRKHGPAKFLREKTEINKEAMLEDIAEAEKVPGIKIKSGGEDFHVDPFDAKLSDGIPRAAATRGNDNSEVA